MADKLVTYNGKKPGRGVKKCKPIETDDMTAILDLTVEAATRHMGRPAEYPNNRQGMDDFINTTIDFFEYVNSVNSNPNMERKLIPDIENWCAFLGISRMTLSHYHQRSGDWRDVIDYYKNSILAVKKQLAMSFKIPPVLLIFDAVNNHNYHNVNEFKLQTDDAINRDDGESQLEKDIRKAKLVWNEDTKEFEPE